MPLINEDFLIITDPNGNDQNVMVNLGSELVREKFSATQYLNSQKYISSKIFDLDNKWFPALYDGAGTINLTGSETMPEIRIKGFDVFLSTINANTKIVISDSVGTIYDQILMSATTSVDYGEGGLRITKTNPGAYFVFSIVNGVGSLTLTGWKN